jgi:HSP20 family protein
MTNATNVPVTKSATEPSRAAAPVLSLQRQIERLFDDFWRDGFALGSTALSPNMDVAETDKEIEIKAEMPGLEEKDIKVSLTDDVLTIRGEKRSEKDEANKEYRLTERSYGAFARTIALPFGVDPAAVKASLANGVLTISAPKPPAKQAKTIEIKSAA